MRKHYILLATAIAAIAFIGCEKDDTPKYQPPTTYGISIARQCNNAGVEYCVSLSTYQHIAQQTNSGQPCQWITFTDSDNQSHSGYFKGMGTPCLNK